MPHSHNTSPPVTAYEGQLTHGVSIVEDSVDTALGSSMGEAATNRMPYTEDAFSAEDPGHETAEGLSTPDNALPDDRHSETKEVAPEALQEYEAFFRDGFDYAKRLAAQRGASDPEAAAMEAFIGVFKTLHTYTPGTNMKAWVSQAVIHRTIDAQRRLQKRPEQPEAMVGDPLEGRTPSSPSAESEILAAHAAEKFEVLLQALPETQRDVVLAVYVSGIPLETYARDNGINPATVRTRLHRGHEKLKRAAGIKPEQPPHEQRHRMLGYLGMLELDDY